MRILVTGGCGFIGHNVVERLQQEGHQVRIIDNETNYGIIPHDELNYLMYERKKKFEYDTMVHGINIDNSSVTSDIIFDLFMPEIVIHLASMPRQKIVNNNPIRGSDVMIGGLLKLLESSIKHEVKKFVYISSSMVYGDFTDDVKENAECNPQGAYAIMKYTGEQLVKDYTRRKNISHTIIRPSAVYGPLDVEDRVISKFMIGAMRGEVLKVYGPEERLDFTYIEDVVEGIVGAALSENTNNKTYNITRSQSITLLEAAQRAINLAGQGSIQVHERDLGFPSRGSLNIYAAKRDFDYSPFVDFKDGLIEYHSWLYNSPFWRKKLSL